MDTVGDFITILRNASFARKRFCCVQWTKVRAALAEVLRDCGFIKDFSRENSNINGHSVLKISLKYVNEVPSITKIERISKPGRRQYAAVDKIPLILGGIGECIVSTSNGIVSGKEAKKLGLGGELMCYVF